MRATAYLIDERGDPKHIGAGLSGISFAPICDFGHVAYSARGGEVRIRLRPSLTSMASYIRLLQWLEQTSAVRIQLSYFVEGQWQHEIAGTTERAGLRVEELVAEYGGGPHGNVHRQRRRLEELRLPASYRSAIEYWRLHRDHFDPAAAAPVLGCILSERFTLFEQNRGGSYIVRGCGKGLADYARKWLENANGRSVQTAPDSLYGQSCMQAYFETECAGEPCIDDVDALVKWTGTGRTRNCYRRLMLPFRSGSRRWMFTSSVTKPAIRLLA